MSPGRNHFGMLHASFVLPRNSQQLPLELQLIRLDYRQQQQNLTVNTGIWEVFLVFYFIAAR
jgi:hypothetical protein